MIIAPTIGGTGNIWWWFLEFRRPGIPGVDLIARDLDQMENAMPGIRCPSCFWRPTRSDKWMCADCDTPEYFYDGCGTEWNTFQTRGLCPGCSHQWAWTSCLECWRWSRHEDWYTNGETT